MYAENDLDIRNRDNVRNNGEVFTPTPIVDSMNDLVPLDAWKDKEFVFIEPTCGNGQFLTRIFEKRIANGLTIEEALNTLIGMDITKENIWDSHLRLFGLACSYMVKNGIKKGSKEWDEQAVRIIAIVSNNRLIGYLSYRIDYYCSKAYNFGLLSFDRGNPVVGEELFNKMEELTKKLRKIEWRMVGGNPVEKHYVETDDGYILGYFRIQKKNSVIKDGLKPVLLQHGLLDSSDSWLVND